MHKRFVVTLVSLALSATLFGCASNPSKQDIGTVLGGIVGGVVGNQFGGGSGKTIFTIAGAIAGAYVGSAVGRSMDDTDRLYTTSNLRENLEQKEPGHVGTSWTRNGNRHYVTDSYTARANGWTPECRSYKQNILIWVDGQERQPETATVTGVACKNPRTGTWEIKKD